jgi:hypothetical protein
VPPNEVKYGTVRTTPDCDVLHEEPRTSAAQYIYIYYLNLRPSICTPTSALRSLPRLVTTIVLQEYSSAQYSEPEHRALTAVAVQYSQSVHNTENRAEEIISILIYIFHPLEFPPACCQLPASSFSRPACIAANPLLPFNFRFRFHFTSTIHNPQSTSTTLCPLAPSRLHGSPQGIHPPRPSAGSNCRPHCDDTASPRIRESLHL